MKLNFNMGLAMFEKLWQMHENVEYGEDMLPLFFETVLLPIEQSFSELELNMANEFTWMPFTKVRKL